MNFILQVWYRPTCLVLSTLPIYLSFFDFINVDEYPAYHALQASATSFYIFKDTKQVLPCTTWTVSDQTCQLQWYKGDALYPSLLINYTAWSDITYADPAFDLGSDFRLVLKSVNDDDGGMYSCTADRETQDDSLDVRVIGNLHKLMYVFFWD